MWITSLTTIQTPTVVALGNFDGIHQGHQRVIGQILHSSEAVLSPEQLPVKNRSILNPPVEVTEVKTVGIAQHQESRGARAEISRPYVTVVTFHPHPQEFFTGQARTLLTPLEEKKVLLRSLGVEQLVLLPFNRELASLSPQQFVEDILIRQLQPKQISVGLDFQFGQKRAGTATDLQAIAANYDIEVNIAPLNTCGGERISSSAIRQALQQGDLQSANRLLGRAYSLIGEVVQGQQLGRTLGFPTANLKLPPQKFLPRQGVYAVWVEMLDFLSVPDSNASVAKTIAGVMNIGHRPTVAGMNQTVEIHLLDWSGSLYGQTLTVNLKEFLRPEQKFESLEALKAQIQADCDTARAILAVANYP